MLKGISPVVSPDLLKTLAEMGHGDEIVLADAHFPGHSAGHFGPAPGHSRPPHVLRADGVTVFRLLGGIMPLLTLDTYEAPLAMMQAVAGDELDPTVEQEYMDVIRQHEPFAKAPERVERQAFYERARQAYAIVVTGEIRKYGNLILKKGVTPR